jgi:hypothetical protein
MIDRYVFVRLKKEHAAERQEIADHSARILAALPGVVRVTAGTPADAPAEAAWDLSIVLRFASVDDVEPYRVHPEHRRYVDEYLAPRTEVIKAWNFAVVES